MAGKDDRNTLPLSCFEEYLFSEDSPAFPMTVTFRLGFSGFLDSEAFRDALAIVLPRHPLLRATVSPGRFGRSTWKDHPEWFPTIHRLTPGDGNGISDTSFMDVTKEPGMRVWLLDRDDGHDLVMRFHHCCTDGKGLMLFVEDLLIAYTLRQNPPERGLALRRLEPHTLRRRSAPRLHGLTYLKAVLMQICVVKEVVEFFLRTPSPLKDTPRVSPGKAPRATHVAPFFFRFDQIETGRIVSAAKHFNATLHELLLRDLLLAVGGWRERKGTGRDGDWLRFSMPVNLRGPGEETMPMANSISLKFIDWRRRDFTGRGPLLRFVREFMKSIDRFYRKYTFLFSVGVARFLPGGISRFTRDSKCYATTCFSNIGRVLDRLPLPQSDGRAVVGNILLESVDIVPPPLRPHMDASFVAYTYGNRLQLGIKYNPCVLSDDDARELLEMYVEEIRGSVQESSRNRT